MHILCAWAVGVCWHPALPQGEWCCHLSIIQPSGFFHIGSHYLLIESSGGLGWFELVCMCLGSYISTYVVWGRFSVCAHFTDVKLTPAEEENLRKRWQQAVGPRYEVVVSVTVMLSNSHVNKLNIKTCILCLWIFVHQYKEKQPLKNHSFFDVTMLKRLLRQTYPLNVAFFVSIFPNLHLF